MTEIATPRRNIIAEQVVGRRLSAVTFVLDYIQLQFDPPPILNALTPVRVVCGGRSARFGDELFRNLICEQIPKTIKSVSLVDEQSLRLILDDDSEIAISLRREDYRGPEAVVLYGTNHVCVVI